MGAFEPASIVITPFPFSDLSATKLRPVLVLADAGNGDYVICQITSNTQGDPDAIPIDVSDLVRGKLKTASVIRPMKLFTAHESLITNRIAVMKKEPFKMILDKVTGLLNPPSTEEEK